MRWSNLTLEADDAARLPGYRDEAVVRRFDAPEALDMRFYEVRARSALNRVPAQSRMPFRWTINPYRGCSHACVYCLSGETPILMADGRTKPLADVRVGDAIYGTVRDGAYRRYVRTEVLAHWSSVKPAYRVTLADGTELIASDDHRFLSRRGWKHVTGAGSGPDCRPHLTLNDELLGTGQFARGPAKDADYEQGYLCGVTRASVPATDRHRSGGVARRLEDPEVFVRACHYLAEVGLGPALGAVAGAVGRAPATPDFRSDPWGVLEQRPALAEIPFEPSDEWCKGFLAGVFDLAGSWDHGELRIVHADVDLIACVSASLRRLPISFATNPPQADCPPSVELLLGLRNALRFLQMTAPATIGRCDLAGLKLESGDALRVVSVEPVGMAMRLYDITTGTGDFIANGIVSHNCFARPTHRYLDFDAGRDFEREIVVKVNAPEVLRVELARPSWKGEHVALGTNTDPYQWVEGRYKLMPGIWEAMRDAANPCSVLTKSPLLLRDLPLMKQIAERTDFTASLSVPTLDEKAWRATEPHTPHPRARLEAVAELNRQGIPAGVLIAPLMPGINDAPEQIEPLLELAAEAGAVSVGGIALHLRGDVRNVFMDWLRGARPDLVDRYEQLYARGAYAPKAERERLGGLVRGRVRRQPAWRLRTRRRAERTPRALPGARAAVHGAAARRAGAGAAHDGRGGADGGGAGEQQALF